MDTGSDGRNTVTRELRIVREDLEPVAHVVEALADDD